jgi:organic radical activating enzyme
MGKTKIVVFGTGNNYLNTQDALRREFDVVALADNNPRDSATVLPHQIVGLGYDYVLITPVRGRFLMYMQLLELGIAVEKIRILAVAAGTGISMLPISAGRLDCWAVRTAMHFSTNGRITPCCDCNYTANGEADKAADMANISALDTSEKAFIDRINESRKDFFPNPANISEVPSLCLRCKGLQLETSRPHQIRKVSRLAFNHYTACNLRCSHCFYVNNVAAKAQATNHKDIMLALDALIKGDVIETGANAGIGGGEPSISPGTRELIDFLVQRGFNVSVNTNCTNFVPRWAEYAKEGKIRLIQTPDAGSREAYKRIKGVDFFDAVWDNIRLYWQQTDRQTDRQTDSIVTKFIIQEGNLADIENMAHMCVAAGARKVQIQLEANLSYQASEGLEMYRQPVQRLKELLLPHGIVIEKGSFLPLEIYGC